MNRFQAIGRYTADPELRYTKDGKAVASFTLAVNNGKDDTSYIKLTAFNKTAENIGKYSKKGDLILVDGFIKNNNYEDKDGNKRYEYQIITNKVEFLSRANNKEKEPETSSNKSGSNDIIFEEFGNNIDISESDLSF